MSIELKLSSPVLDVPRVGPAKASQLARIGITHARDFLYLFPRRYDDFSRLTPINELVVGQQMTVSGTVKSVKQSWGFQGRRRLLRIFVEIEDATGILTVMWFNLHFIAKQLWIGRPILVAGKVELNVSSKKNTNISSTSWPVFRMRSPVMEFVKTVNDATHTGRITPIYPETYGVTSRFLRHQVKTLLPLIDVVPEYMPIEIRERNHLIGIQAAIKAIHFPASSSEIAVAQQRLRFDELFFLQLAAQVRRQERVHQPAPAMTISKKSLEKFAQTLDFKLTKAQQASMAEVEADLAARRPMNRLLQGDVGSGKSVVALYATQLVLQSGYSVLYLAPTEILARQQAHSFSQHLGVETTALLIGALSKKEKEKIKGDMAGTVPQCYFGTHALLQDDVRVSRLGLVIVDEQHRFGVAQRQKLQAASSAAAVPHLLSMTATPIPRTLSLTVYGDLDVSVIDELPPGRMPIQTKVVAPDDRDEAIIHILAEMHAGRQGYVITPLVENSTKLEAKSAKQAFAEMKKLFPDISVGLLHGQMSSEEKAAALNNFSAGAIQLLVATAVVEVGVNVPNASIMIIEGAERFGLAQLHQFRGRIGRSAQQSYCYLFPTKAEDADSSRLQLLTETCDGFKIAEEDLKIRGPGEIYGLTQSGFGNLQVASLLDYAMIKLTRGEAINLLAADPTLAEYPILRAKVAQKNLQTHFE